MTFKETLQDTCASLTPGVDATNLDSSITSLDETFSSTGGALSTISGNNNKNDTDSLGTLKNVNAQTTTAQTNSLTTAIVPPSPPQPPVLYCNCVWSVHFKLHRLHQTLQKVHDPISSLSGVAGGGGGPIPGVVGSSTSQYQQLLANTSGNFYV